MSVDKLGSPDLLLKGFSWHGDRRPKNKEEIMFRKGDSAIQPSPLPKKEKKKKDKGPKKTKK